VARSPSKLHEVGSRVSDAVADAAGHPLSQLLVVLVCGAGLALGDPAIENALALILSVSAITLTQMVLNQQKRHDAALHLKIDELIYAKRGARDELAGIEGSSAEHLDALRRSEDRAAATATDQADRAPLPPGSHT
jgi:low affinity Fe/Cu permease